MQWRYLLSIIQALPLSEMWADLSAQTQKASKYLIVRRAGMGGWLLVSSGTAAMLFWNGRLVVATGVGVAVMMLVYLLHDWRPKLPWAEIRKLLHLVNQPIALAAVGGGVATLSTYLAASIWADSESPWIASGAILQGMGTLTVLGLLVGQMLGRQATHDRNQFNQSLTDLTHTDPLKRLIAVRQLIALLPDLPTNGTQQQEIAECFRLLVSREDEPIVREATLDGLQKLDLQARSRSQKNSSRRPRSLQPSSRPVMHPPQPRTPVLERKRVSSDR